MSRTTIAAPLAAGIILLVIFTAGFFRPEFAPASMRDAKALPACKAPAAPPAPQKARREAMDGLLALTNSPHYKRTADFSLKVADCAKAEDDLEARLEAIKGEILDMLMEGTEGSRTCTLAVLVPSDQFRAFIAGLRGMGKIQSERITASRIKPGPATTPDPDPADAREFSLVSIRMADEKVAPQVLESRGLLAASFDKSASHFMDGMAVLIEVIGYALPFLIAILAAAIPLLGLAWLRRRRIRVISEA